MQQEADKYYRKMRAERKCLKKKNKKPKTKKTNFRKLSEKRANRYIYCLLLDDNKYYVGQTTDINRRFEEHTMGFGSKWTKLYQPVKIVESIVCENVTESECVELEDKKTLEYAEKYGYNNVRGGKHCAVHDFFYKTGINNVK